VTRTSRLYTAEGIVLKRKVTGEADRILTLFTRRLGKIRVLAKGIRKIQSRRAGHLEVFNRVAVTLHTHGTLDIVTEASAVSRGTFLSRSPACIAYAYCMCELVDQLLADRQEQEDVYLLLADALAGLEHAQDEEAWSTILSGFIHSLLWSLGFLPEDRRLPAEAIRPYVEEITERKLKTWPLLTVLSGTS